jgi:hypothetical protein
LAGENRITRRKTCPSATLSTTNPTWIDPGANSSLRGERPATNRLSHGTAAWLKYFTYHLLLVPVLTPNYKQHILSPAKVKKMLFISWTLSDVFIWIYSGGGGREVYETFLRGHKL